MAYNHVGEKIREARKNRGISQSRLSQLSGVAQSSISTIEKGLCSPSVDTLKLIADALHIEMNELMEGKEKAANDERDSMKSEIIQIYDCLDDKTKSQALSYLRFLLSEQDRKV